MVCDNNELWKDVDGFSNYQISNHGRIKNSKTQRIKQILNNGGFDYVNLTQNGSATYHKIHHLVAKTFLTNDKKLPYVDHIDGDISNNHVSNLKWTSECHSKREVSQRVNNSSGYRGVAWCNHANKWRVQKFIEGKQRHVGYFDTKEDGAKAFDRYVLDDNPKKIRTNFEYPEHLKDIYIKQHELKTMMEAIMAYKEAFDRNKSLS